MAATSLVARVVRTLIRLFGPVAGGLLVTQQAKAVDVPEDKGEAMFHIYKGGGVEATGPALLVRKSIADRTSIAGSYYVDMVSNASIDVVTTASPFKERRTAYDVSVDHAVRDGLVSFGINASSEPDYKVDGFNVDVSQEVFGGMTTVALGYSRSKDKVGQKNIGFFDTAEHWQYRFGLTQILSPRWLVSANLEAVSDSGFLGSPYRVARVFGAAVPERNPRTRTSRALKLRSIHELGERNSVRAEYRYFWDTWGIKAHTLEGGYARYFGDRWLGDGFVRLNSQSKAIFYSDNATTETQYLSRNRQLGTFKSFGFGGHLAYSYGKVVDGKLDMKINTGYEYMRFRYSDFTDLRTGGAYGFNAHILQLYLTATY